MARLPALQYVTLHGHDVGFRRAGKGETVLLLHGLAGSSKTWEATFDRLAERFDVIAPDMLGHGESAKPEGDYSLGAFAAGLRDLLLVLKVPRVTVVGHSFGGGVAMQFAYQFPQMMDRLVLVGSGGLGREVSWLLRLCSLPGAELLMPFWFPRPVVGVGNKVGRAMKRQRIHSPKLGEMWRAYSSLAGAENRNAFVRTMRGVIGPGGQVVSALDRLYLAAIVPTLIVWGDQDQIIPVDHARLAHEAAEHSRLEILEGVGHFPHVEAPDRFCDVLIDFVESTAPGSRHTGSLRDLMLERSA